MIYPSKKNELYNMCKFSISMLEELWRLIKKENMQDEQFVLDWINKIDDVIEIYEQHASTTEL